MKNFSPNGVLRSWREALQQSGYAIEGGHARRRVSPLLASIAAVKSRGRVGFFHVNLDILVQDKYLPTENYEVCFRAFLAEGKCVATHGDYRHFSLQEIEEAGRQVSDAVIPWLGQQLVLERVIQLIQEARHRHCRIEDLQRPTRRDGPASVEVLNLIQSTGYSVGAPHFYAKHLALLQEEVGQREAACASLMEWFRRVANNKDAEPARSLRQMQSLGCGASRFH